jgi:hypothetical protein
MNPFTATFPDYTNASYHKTMLSDAAMKSGTTTGSMYRYSSAGSWRNTAAIAGIRLISTGNNFATGSRVTLYGLR